MQSSFKKIEAFFFGTEMTPYTPHLNHKSWILLPLVLIGILPLVLVRALSIPKRKSMPYKAAQTWNWVASGPPLGDTLGLSFLPYSFVKPTSTDKGAIPRRLLCCGSVQSSSAQLPRDAFENLTVLLKARGWEKCASVRLMNRPLTTTSFLLLLPRGWAKAQRMQSTALLCPASFHLTHPCSLQLRSFQCYTEPAEPPAKFST